MLMNIAEPPIFDYLQTEGPSKYTDTRLLGENWMFDVHALLVLPKVLIPPDHPSQEKLTVLLPGVKKDDTFSYLTYVYTGSIPSEPAKYEGFLNFIKMLWPAEIPEGEAFDVQKGGETVDVRNDSSSASVHDDSCTASFHDDSFPASVHDDSALGSTLDDSITASVPDDSFKVSSSDSTMAFVLDDSSTVTTSASTKDSVQDNSPTVRASESTIIANVQESSTVCVQVDLGSQVELDFIQFDLGNGNDLNIDTVDNNLNKSELSNPTRKLKVLNLPTKKRAKGVPDNVKCEICGVLIQFKKNLQRHIQSHHVKKKFSCDTCVVDFSDEYHLTRHLKSKNCLLNLHYECKKCKKKFVSDKKLKTHNSKNCPKKFFCNECFIFFKSQKSYESHTHM